MSVADRVPVARIGVQARQVRAGRVALSVLTGLFFVAGWLAYRVLSGLWLAVVWCAVATREGWRDARRSSGVSRGST